MAFSRRQFVASAAAAIPAITAQRVGFGAPGVGAGPRAIAPFRFDVTPPIGHSCCGGWIPDVAVIDDRLEAVGFVLLGAGRPIVVCAVDWCALANSAHQAWMQKLAEAAHSAHRLRLHHARAELAPRV